MGTRKICRQYYIFKGANRFLGSPYGLDTTECCELTRVALRKHEYQVTKMISVAIRHLKKHNDGLRLIISYADGNQGHLGKIYQAGNWVYVGKYATERGVVVNGKLKHRRSINSRYGTSGISFLRKNVDPNAVVVKGKAKYKYLMPLDENMRKQIVTLAKEYPASVV